MSETLTVAAKEPEIVSDSNPDCSLTVTEGALLATIVTDIEPDPTLLYWSWKVILEFITSSGDAVKVPVRDKLPALLTAILA